MKILTRRFLAAGTVALGCVQFPGPVTAASEGVPPELSVALAIQGSPEIPPLPAEPPIGGPLWTVFIPAVLFLGSFLGTFLLYRRFSRIQAED